MSSHLVLLQGAPSVYGAVALSLGLVAGGLVAICWNFLRLRRYRFVLRALALQSTSIEADDLGRLSDEPARLVWAWVLPSTAGAVLSVTLWRPDVLDLASGITLSLLGVIMISTVSLPLFLLLRLNVLRALELSPPAAMRDLAELAEHDGYVRQHVARRLLAAVLTPVGVLSLGAALIVNAHLRRADELAREETARAFARSVLEESPGVVPAAGLNPALLRARSLGFSAQMLEGRTAYSIKRGQDSLVLLTTPLDHGGAEVRFKSSSVRALSENTLLLSLGAVLAAAAAGLALGHILRRDLVLVARRVRLLGTETLPSNYPAAFQKATFTAISELGDSIEELAARFRQFSRAQERAIDARERAAKMRGLFFASVSHDLKSPLNAILGFTELVRQTDVISQAQAESLGVIERRGKELLALIETILDAARVEAGLLTLLPEVAEIDAMVEQSNEIGRYLGGESKVEIVTALPKERPQMLIDRIRLPRALGTFIGYAIRTAKGPIVRVHVVRVTHDRIRMDIEIPEAGLTRKKLLAVLDPSKQPGVGEHRGLALGLRVARSVVELHHGTVAVREQKPIGAYFSVTLPTLDAFREVR
ncbi:MAG: HAMP domain-containing sensor histidine kinase [Polyangiaceae bacterium]|nr:HAMP domain-containing sensor histidine kinase [Polyangiaceae bacterium]